MVLPGVTPKLRLGVKLNVGTGTEGVPGGRGLADLKYKVVSLINHQPS